MKAPVRTSGDFVNSQRGTRNAALALGMAATFALSGCGVPTTAEDGDYRGTATRSQLPQRRNCPRPGLLHIRVANAVFLYRWDNQYIQASVLSSGSVRGSGPGVQLTGSHSGGLIEGDVRDAYCGLHFTLRRVSG